MTHTPTPAHQPGMTGGSMDERPDFAKVLAEHDAKVGPITGYWTCACGVQSDNTQTCKGGPQPFDRRAEYRAHLAAALDAEETQ